MDLTTLLGITVASGLFFIPILVGEPGARFIDYPSLMIVIVGTMGVTSINYSLADGVSISGDTKNAFRHRTTNDNETHRALKRRAEIISGPVKASTADVQE